MRTEPARAELIEDRTERVASRPPGPGGRRTVGSGPVTIALLVGILVVIAAAGLLGSQRDLFPLAVASESAPGTTRPASLTPGPLVTRVPGTPTPEEAACGEGRVALASENGSWAFPGVVPAKPPGLSIAIAVEQASTVGQVIVAGQGDSRAVASFSGSDIPAVSGVQVVDSARGRLLVVTQHASRLFGGPGNCGDVFVVEATGGNVTHVGAGAVVTAAGFAPNGRVGYLDGSTFHRTDGLLDEEITLGNCESGATMSAWSPNGRQVAMLCDGSALTVIDPDAGSAVQRPFDVDGRTPLAFAWADDDSIVLAVADDGTDISSGPIHVLDVKLGRNGLTSERRLSTAVQSEWVLGRPTISPDLHWLLVQGGGDLEGPAYYPTYRIDLRTGAAHKLPFPVLSDDYPSPVTTWLPGSGDRVLVARFATLYEVDLVRETRTEVGAVPASDYLVLLP